MSRLLIHVEGQTEAAFVSEVLREHLVARGYHDVSPRIFGNGHGGVRPWTRVRQDIVDHLKEDKGSIATTMVDYYGMPASKNGWPGRAGASELDTESKAQRVEAAMHGDVSKAMGKNFQVSRFVPFVLMHEFEGLLFSDCAAFSSAVGKHNLAAPLQQIRSGFATPEDINDSSVTAPSKRIVKLMPDYEKPLFGAIAVLEIGVEKIRGECPLFNAWLTRLEQLVRIS